MTGFLIFQTASKTMCNHHHQNDSKTPRSEARDNDTIRIRGARTHN